MDKIADFGQQWLLNNSDKYRLEIVYENDMEQVFVQLRDLNTNKCTVFDADNIFAQVHEFAKKHDDITTYVISGLRPLVLQTQRHKAIH